MSSSAVNIVLAGLLAVACLAGAARAQDRGTAPGATPERRAFWTTVAVGAVVATGAAVAFGVWLLESRRALRRRAAAIEQRVLARIQTDAQLSGVRALVTPRMPLWRGPVQLDLIGSVRSPTQHTLLRDLVEREASAAGFPVRLHDAVRVEEAGVRGGAEGGGA